jgi:hypothetical protein
MSDESSSKESKGSELLVSVAESIGSTLGSIAAKVSEAKKALVPGTEARKVAPKRKKPTARRPRKKTVKASKTAAKPRTKSRQSVGRTARTAQRTHKR